jgi:hypothetical protein
MKGIDAGYTRYDHKDAPYNLQCVAAVERESSSYDVEAQLSVDWSLNENLFGDNQAQDLQSDSNAMDAWVGVSEPSKDDSNISEQSQVGHSDTRAEEPVVNQV